MKGLADCRYLNFYTELHFSFIYQTNRNVIYHTIWIKMKDFCKKMWLALVLWSPTYIDFFHTRCVSDIAVSCNTKPWCGLAQRSLEFNVSLCEIPIPYKESVQIFQQGIHVTLSLDLRNTFLSCTYWRWLHKRASNFNLMHRVFKSFKTDLHAWDVLSYLNSSHSIKVMDDNFNRR